MLHLNGAFKIFTLLLVYPLIWSTVNLNVPLSSNFETYMLFLSYGEECNTFQYSTDQLQNIILQYKTIQYMQIRSVHVIR